MTKATVLILHPFLPDGILARWNAKFPQCRFIDVRQSGILDRHLKDMTIAYGVPPVSRLGEAPHLRWIQLLSAGVPADLCPLARERGLTVTNLAGLYGPTIAEHALALMLILRRNLHAALRNQQARAWDRSVAKGMADLHGTTLAIVGVGNIGQNIARLARSLGMRVLGCRRTPRPTPYVDELCPRETLAPLLAQADIVAVAAPLTRESEGMLGPAEFNAMKPGAIYVNVSRGPVAQESALLTALRSGRLAGAGLDVFAVEPLAADHPFWTMPQVVISPHTSGETVNHSALPAQRFTRNLRSWLPGLALEGRVNLELGY